MTEKTNGAAYMSNNPPPPPSTLNLVVSEVTIYTHNQIAEFNLAIV